ncbi:unnamed protein product, partial [Amoebophrya sp. A25]
GNHDTTNARRESHDLVVHDDSVELGVAEAKKSSKRAASFPPSDGSVIIPLYRRYGSKFV